MTHEILNAAGLHDELSARLRRLEVRTAHVFGQVLPNAPAVYATTDRYLALLQGAHGAPNADAAVVAALVLQQELIDPAELATPAFWATALGRAIGYWTGGYERWDGGRLLGVPQVEAAAILNVTRQNVTYAIGQKRLVSCGPGLGVTALSVAVYAHARYPLGIIEVIGAVTRG